MPGITRRRNDRFDRAFGGDAAGAGGGGDAAGASTVRDAARPAPSEKTWTVPLSDEHARYLGSGKTGNFFVLASRRASLGRSFSARPWTCAIISLRALATCGCFP